jgi:hypothetical protein
MDHPTPASSRITLSHCSHLRHKGMYVMAEVDPGDYSQGAYEATAYWCAKTQKSFGPDGDIVGREMCRHGRSCCG